MGKQENDARIKAFFEDEKKASDEVTNAASQMEKAIARSRTNLAQRDTIMFAFIKLWTTAAEMLAPIFAALLVRQSKQGMMNCLDKKTNKYK